MKVKTKQKIIRIGSLLLAGGMLLGFVIEALSILI